MIPFAELSAALARWRVAQGLPVTEQDQAGLVGAAPTFVDGPRAFAPPAQPLARPPTPPHLRPDSARPPAPPITDKMRAVAPDEAGARHAAAEEMLLSDSQVMVDLDSTALSDNVAPAGFMSPEGTDKLGELDLDVDVDVDVDE